MFRKPLRLMHSLVLLVYLMLAASPDLHHNHGMDCCGHAGAQLEAAHDPCPVDIFQLAHGDAPPALPATEWLALQPEPVPYRLEAFLSCEYRLPVGRGPPACLFS